MNQVGGIYIGLHYDGRGAAGFNSAANTVIRDSDRMRRALGGTERSMGALRNSMGMGMKSRYFTDMLRQASAVNNELGRMRAMMLSFGAMTGIPLGATFGLTWLTQTADQAQLMRNQLRTVTEGEENLLAVRQRLYHLSQDTRSDLQATITVYARLSRATEHLGLSQERLVRATETIQKAFAIGGATQQEAWGAAIQLSQGIASDRFSGEEFRSVAENAPVLLRGMAQSLGIGIGKLREMAHAGQLTAGVVTQAILDASDAIDANFAKIDVTVGQALTRVNNAFLNYIGNVDRSAGYTRMLAQALSNLAEHFDEVMAVGGALFGLGAAGLGGRLLGGGLIGGQIRAAQELKKLRTDELKDAQAIHRQRVGELNTVRSSILAEQQRLTAVVNARHAVGAASADIRKSYEQEKLSSQQLVALRQQQRTAMEGVGRAAEQVVKAQRNITASAMVMSRLRGLGTGLIGALGGVPGVAIMAAIVAFGTLANEIQKAQQKSRDLTRELHELGMISDRAAGAIDSATQSLSELTADELRQKLRAIGEEINNLTKFQNVFERLFNYDPRALGNIESELNELISRNTAITGGGRAYEFAPDSQQGMLAAQASGILAILEQVRSGSIRAEEAIAQLDAAAVNLGDIELSDAAQLDGMIGRLRTTVELLEAFGIHAENIEANLSAISQSEGWNAALRTAEALNKVGDQLAITQDSLRGIADYTEEQIRVLGLTEEQARIEAIIAAMRKDAVGDKQADNAAVEAALRAAAQEVYAAEQAAEARKAARKEAEQYLDALREIDRELRDMPEIGDNAEAVANTRQLVAEFVTGRVTAEQLQARLISIGKTDISSGMDGLIKKILEAIPQLQGMLNILRKFPGMGFLGDVDTTYGGPDTVPNITKRQNEAAEAAKRYAEGMAELRREVELANMDGFVNSVYDTAKGLGVSADELERFVAAVQTGGLDSASAKFQDIANALRDKSIAETMRDLAEESATMFMSPWDKTIFDALKDTGIELDSIYGRIIANQIRLNEGLKMGGEWAREAFGGLAKDLMNGVSLTDALNSAVGRLRDRMMDMALDLLGNAAMGFFQNLIGGMFGGGGMIYGQPASFTPGVGWMRNGFSSGTANTGGQRGEPRGIVHGKEAVIPLTSGDKVPVDLRITDLISSLAGNGLAARASASLSGVAKGIGDAYRNLKVEIVNESGQPIETRSAGMRREGDLDIVTIVAGAMGQAAMSGKLGAFESIYGMKRRTV